MFYKQNDTIREKISTKIKLFENCDDVYLETFCPEKIWDITRDAVLIFPGGGYDHAQAYGPCLPGGQGNNRPYQSGN